MSAEMATLVVDDERMVRRLVRRMLEPDLRTALGPLLETARTRRARGPGEGPRR